MRKLFLSEKHSQICVPFLFILILIPFLFNSITAKAQVTVNPGGASYATLGAAFTAINNGTHTGTITIDINGNTNEGATVAILNASGSGAASYTSVTITPSGGVVRTISGAPAGGNPLIDLSGADNVTIDGLLDRGNSLLTIENTTASGTAGTSTIRFIGGATNNTITRCILKGSASAAVTTAGAVVLFSVDGVTTNGNDNNTISKCDIGPSGSNLPTKCIQGNGTTTTTAIGNSGIIINDNDIHDYFGAAVTSAGVATVGGCNTWSVTGNRFYQTATRTWTTGAEHNAINLGTSTATSGMQGATITDNIIGYSANNQTGTYALTGVTGKFIGIRYNAITGAAIANINNNTITAISLTGVTSSGTSTSSPMTAILVVNGLANTNNNIIGSQSATGAITFSTNSTSATDIYGIYNFSVDNCVATGNQIGGITVTNAAASGTYVIYLMRINTGTSLTATITSNMLGGTVSNSVQLSATGAASQIIGIHTSNAALSFSSNTIRNLTNNIGTGTTTGASVIGININTTLTSHNLSQNVIYGLTNTNASSASTVTGIQFTGATANVVSKNLIHSLVVASATGIVNGIQVVGGTGNFSNNMIRLGVDANGNDLTTGFAINGINETGGTNNFYYNSIYVGGTGVGGTVNTFAFSSTVTANTRNYRNNIFYNARSNGGGTGKHYAFRYGGTTANPAGLTSNNNLYFANGTGGVLGLFNAVDINTLALIRSSIGQDANSCATNPQYIAPNGNTATLDLHINAGIPTQVESGGTPLPVTDDYDGNTRNSSTPDIGADEGTFTILDVVGPSITSPALTNIACLTSSRTFSVTIADATGVNTNPGSRPRVYYRKSTNTDALGATNDNTTDGWKYVEASNTTSPFSFAIDYNLLFGGASLGDVIQYFIVAQDNVTPTANISVSGVTLTAIPSSVNLTGAAFPSSGQSSYNIFNPISGNVNVGPGETYTSFSAAGGLFAAINAQGISGNVTANITGNITTEDGANALNTIVYGCSGPSTLTIKPTGNYNVSGSSAIAIIRINAADNVIIDGSLSNTANSVCPSSSASINLSFINNNTGTASAVIQLSSNGTDGATNNVIRNCSIQGSGNTQTVLGISIGGSTIGTTGTNNNYNQVVNNTFSKVQYGIYSAGASNVLKNTGNIFNQNIMNTASPNNLGRGGIVMFFEDSATISGNVISEVAFSGSGDVFGISCGFGLSSFNATNSASAGEITNSIISNNTIGNIVQTSTHSAAGIAVGATTSGINTISNNMIYGVNANSTSPDITAGILLGGSSTNLRVYNNTVTMQGTMVSGSAGTQTTACLAITNASPTNVDIRNNILVNTQVGNTGATTRFTAIALGYSSTVGNYTGLISDNNNIYVAGAGPGTYAYGITGGVVAGTSRTSFADLKTETGKDVNSQNVLPVFTSSSNLHLDITDVTNATSLNAKGTSVSGVTADIDCETRNTSFPDIGADEIDVCFANGGTAAVTSPICINTGTTITASGFATGSGSAYQWQYSSDNFGSDINDLTGQTTAASAATGNVAATTYYRLKVSCTLGSLTAYSNVVTLNVDPASVGGTASSNQTICSGTSPVDLTLSGNTGNVTKWQFSTDAAFTSPTDIANTTTTLSGAAIGNLTATTYFRAVVKSGVCAAANSSTVTITVDPITVAGTVSSNQTICSGTSPADLTLSGNTGSVTKWQRSTDAAFTSPTDIANTTTTLSGATIGNLTATTYFRAVVQSGVCATANSSSVSITVDPVSVGGTVSSNQTICSGTQPANLTLSGNTGNVTKWQRSTDAAFTSPTDIANTTTTLSGATIGNLTATTYFRAVVQSGVCATANSASVTITVDPVSVGGTVSSNQTICSGTQPTNLTLSGNTGTVTKWQRSTDAAFTSPTDIANTTTTLSGATIGNLTATTYFRAVVQSGVCATANSSTVTITVDPVSVGGTVSSNQTVCSGTQPSNLTLSGNTGNVTKWQRSTDAAFTSPTDIANTTTTLSGATIGNLTATTYFRAVVQSGVCATANSSTVTITVDPVSVGGTVSSNQTICSGTQPSNLTLSGNTGNVTKWQRSTDAAFTSPTDIANTTTTLSGATIGNLTATTYFRAVVQSGVCATANSSTVTITVDPVSVGGTVSSNQTICSGTQPSNLTLSGNTGNVTKWQRSTDAAFTSPTDIANTTTTLSGATIGNLTATTYFRAVVQSGVCATANSSSVTITVDPVSVGGTVSSNQTICSGTQPSNLTLSGNTGTVTKWQRSTDAAFTSPTDIANTTTTLSGATIGNLTATTYFRAVVQSGVCATANSSTVTITVDPVSVGGTVSSNQTICSGTQPSNLTLSGNTGTVTKWQRSTDAAFTSPTDIANTTTTLSGATIGNLTATTYFRAVVQSGVCATANSSSVTITVDPVSVGGTVSSNQTICSGTQPSNLTLSGNTGTVTKWQRSTDAAFTSPTDIANTTTTLSGATIGNLTATTYFRAVVQSGVCATANSSSVTITVDPVSVGGTVSSNQTICSGTQPSNLTLSGNTGTVTKWQRSTDAAFTSPTDIANTTTTLSGATIGNLTVTTYFRAVVQSGVCATANSSSVTITVDPVSVGGTVSSAQTICIGNSLTSSLTLSGNTGTVLKWQRAADAAFTSPTDITNASATLTAATAGALITNTYFRAVVQSGGVCASANSSPVLVTVNSTIDNTTVLAGTTGGAQVSATYNISASNNYLSNCALIATVAPSGASPVSGVVTAAVKIDNAVQTAPNSQPYVQRYFNITPAANAATATSIITLYFKQAEFTAYNVARGIYPALPTGASDATGIANLRITQYNGTGTAPGNYTGTASIIDPADANITYNATADRWSISFTATGSGGFYVHTGTWILPVTITAFNGENAGNINKLYWNTSSETNSKGFELERSADGISFTRIAFVATKANGGNSTTSLNYTYDDKRPLVGANYYRLKQIDNDGKYAYSNVVLLNRKVTEIMITKLYPNPANTELNVQITSPRSEKLTLVVTDLTGKIVMQQSMNIVLGDNQQQLQIGALAGGTYMLKAVCANGCETAVQRFVKQ